jgi:hypothetical protein
VIVTKYCDRLAVKVGRLDVRPKVGNGNVQRTGSTDAPLLAIADGFPRSRNGRHVMSMTSVPSRSKTSTRAREAGVVLMVGRPQAAVTWHTCSEGHGLQCVEAEDVTAALDLLRRTPRVALVVASTVDENSLRRLCGGVRQVDAFRYAPIVASGPRDEALRRRSRDAGVDAYVPEAHAASLAMHVQHWLKLVVELEPVVKRHLRVGSKSLRRRRSDQDPGAAGRVPRERSDDG